MVFINGANMDAVKRTRNLRKAFSDAGTGGVIDIAPGNYLIDAPLVLGSNDVTINGNGATITTTKDFDGSIIDYTGVRRSLTNRLNVVTSKKSLSAVIMGRTARGDSSGHTFRSCHFQGYFSLAGIYSYASEGCVYDQCNFVTHTEAPCYISTSIDETGIIDSSGQSKSNTLGWFYNCSFRNYSGLSGVSLLRFSNTTSGFSIRDSYAYVGNNGIFIDIDGHSQGLLLDAIRVEGEGDDALLIRNSSSSFLYQTEIKKINWTVPSNHMIESSHHILECVLDLMHGCAANRFIHMKNLGKLWRTRLYGNKPDWITLDDGCQIRMCHLTWINGEPQSVLIPDSVVHWVN